MKFHEAAMVFFVIIMFVMFGYEPGGGRTNAS